MNPHAVTSELISLPGEEPLREDDLQSQGPSPLKAGDKDKEESIIELIDDTLHEMDPPVQGAFLQKFLKCLASVDVSEAESLAHWQEILRQRKDLASALNRPVSLRTAAVDYFSSADLLRNPILLEYGEFKRLRHNAATDPLTGFYNRRLFEDYLARELNRASRYSTPFALILIDLRDFKKVNDTHGHAVGDEVLRSVPRACTETIRGSDYPFRIGGDEFAVLLPQSDSRSAESLARRIAQRFEHYARSLAPGVAVGLDYGVGSFPVDGATAASLFETADRNLYLHKRTAGLRPEGPPVEPTQGEVEGSEPVPKPAPSAELAPAKSVVAMPAAPSLPPKSVKDAEPVSEEQGQDAPRRHHPRFPLEGSWSLGVIVVGSLTELVRILDISTGGVGLLVDEGIKVPDRFQARLNVPIFSSSGLTLRRMYARQGPEGKQRIGCAFDA